MLHLGHAEARSGAGRLDEQRVRQSGLLDLSEQTIGISGEPRRRVEAARVHGDAGSDRNAGGGQQHLRVMLVHARGGREHAATDVRHIHHLQQTLNRAVLAIRAVQNRQHRVNVPQRAQRAVVVAGEEAILPERHVQHDVARAGSLLDDRQTVGHIPSARVLAVHDPLALLGDAHRHRLEPVGVKRAQHAGSRNAGNRMLVGLAAIHHHNANLGRFSHVFLPCHVLHILGHSLIRAMAHRPVTIRLLQNPPNSAGWAPVRLALPMARTTPSRCGAYANAPTGGGCRAQRDWGWLMQPTPR